MKLPVYIKKRSIILLFLFIVCIGLYLRFWHAEAVISFGWDQARDSWKVRDIINGQLLLHGPKTGIGDLHLGPLYFYFLVPFYLATSFDPIGAIYFNIVVNIVTFLILFFVTKKIFSEKAALFAVFIYAFSEYIIKINQTSWNVSLIPATTLLIFFSIWKIHQGNYRWFVILGALCGFYYHVHFTAVFLPLIVLLSILPILKRKALPWIGLGIVAAGMFLLPIVISEIIKSSGEQYRILSFSNDYVHRPNFQFLLFRLPDALIQFQTILFFPFLSWLRYVIPVIFSIIIFFFERDKKKKVLGWIILPWFYVPLIGFTSYKGPISDYYFLASVPFVIYILIYLQSRLLQLRYKLFLVLFILFWTVYAFYNTKNLWVKPIYGGLKQQKDEVRERIKQGHTIEFNEGDIKAYLYVVWTNDKK